MIMRIEQELFFCVCWKCGSLAFAGAIRECPANSTHNRERGEKRLDRMTR